MTTRPLALAVASLLVAIAGALGLVVHFGDRAPATGAAVVPSLSPAGVYTPGSVPSSAGQAALDAANREVPALLSYDYRDLSESLARAQAETTGEFRASFTHTFQTTIATTAHTEQDVATSSVRGAAYVGTAASGSVTCLLFVDQTLSRGAPTAGTPARQVDEDRVVVTMARVGGGWLIAGLTPV